MDLGTESLEYRFRKNSTRDTGDTTSAFDQVNKETHPGCLRPKVSEICRKRLINGAKQDRDTWEEYVLMKQDH